ncbi:MAG: hypothetical protein MR346_11295 [Clostridium sp.]|nr:hypothetical protein [Clostridium sp.]
MEKSSFFNSIQASDGSYDREYLAEDFARYFASFIGNGVFPNPSTNLQVLSNNDMTVSIDIGKAYINGYYYENTTKLVKTIDIADGVLNRIDLVVLRLDFTNREIKTYVKKGTFASSPKAQSLQRDSDMYELGIAEVHIDAGATTITQANITDLRLDSNSCGVVHGVVEQVDTTTIFNQFEAWYKEKTSEYESNMTSKITELDSVSKNKINELDTAVTSKIAKYETDMTASETNMETQFNTWFNNVKNKLDGDVATNLENQINEIDTKVSSNTNKIETVQSQLNDLSFSVENGVLTISYEEEE